MTNYILKTMPNHLRTVFVPMKQTNAVTILLLVNTGSRFENKANNGISHFLEHLFFKGTKKRPNTLDIANELDSIGASYNAFTSEEYTGFFVRCSKNKFEIAIDILSDIITNSVFNEAEISKEKNVIIEEINMYEDLPQRQIGDITKEHFYGDSPLGRSTLGEKSIIRGLNRSDFLAYKNSHYLAENSVLVIAGNGEIKKWEESVKSHFGGFSSGKYPVFKKISEPNSKPSVKIKYKKTDQAHITLGLKTFERNDNRNYILRLINNILGETMSSRLFTEVREKRGLSYYVGSEDWSFADTGILTTFAGVDTKRLNEAIEVIAGELRKMKNHTITARELQKAKDNIEGKMYLGLEDSFSVAEFYAEQELLKKKVNKPEEILKKIKKISLSQANDLAKSIFSKNNYKLTIIGPYKSDTQFLKLIS